MSRYSHIFFLIIILTMIAFMIINPQETVYASSIGFKLWYSILFPALFPFFIIAELLVNLGFVRFLGILLEPVMRPLFRLPGCSSLVVAMGFTSGYPVGALLTKKLYDEKMITANDAERLVSFTNNSSPLFIMGAVGVGMLSNPTAGYLLAISHYLSNLLLGFLLRFKGDNSIEITYNRNNLISDALHTLIISNSLKNKSIGNILLNAIKNSLNNILAIAGFIVIFSVLTRMLSIWGIMDILTSLIMQLFSYFNISYSLSYGLSMSIFELTLGTKTIAACSCPLLVKLMTISAVLAFGGFCIIAQIMSIMEGIPVRLSFYLYARLIQMSISLSISFLLYKFLFKSTFTSFAYNAISNNTFKALYSFDAWAYSVTSMMVCLLIILIMIILAGLKKTN